jgi:hypothetical protein
MYYTFSTTRTRLFYDRNDPHKISKKNIFFDHYLQLQQKCIILADEYWNCLRNMPTVHSLKRFNVILFFPIHKCLINTHICRDISLAADCWLEF